MSTLTLEVCSNTRHDLDRRVIWVGRKELRQITCLRAVNAHLRQSSKHPVHSFLEVCERTVAETTRERRARVVVVCLGLDRAPSFVVAQELGVVVRVVCLIERARPCLQRDEPPNPGHGLLCCDGEEVGGDSPARL